jgi:hypothetical protein
VEGGWRKKQEYRRMAMGSSGGQVWPRPEEFHLARASAGWGRGCRLPTPGPQGAQDRVQWLECGLLL